MVRLTENYREALLTSAKNEIYQPHQIIHADGQRENRLWFLEQGFVRSYYFDHTGREHTLAFYDNKELVFPMKVSGMNLQTATSKRYNRRY
ncbi:hypothetical protein HK413_05055 [Mucilaginibacter sp. S1162]|uniref:Cyclic nucleotide-binding domain-containing protein n=1 Tax=Mucilaginibacter humi TaxID=2732510 RepID=A0ABX1W0C6_9SPHI|nr:hypothetical protein [Mucilaginibacter humi]NNU33672.1 hypothetical protein [Mucilaginibacter humi]